MLRERARERLEKVKQSIDREISEHRPGFGARVKSAKPDDEHAQWYRAPVIRFAERRGYFANPRAYQAWVRLGISDDEASTYDDLVVSFHAIGREFRGVIAVTAFYEQHQVSGGERILTEPAEDVSSTEPFQLNYRDMPEAAAERFDHWLEEAVAIGLSRWLSRRPRSSG